MEWTIMRYISAPTRDMEAEARFATDGRAVTRRRQHARRCQAHLGRADDETTWERERPRLVRLCATITGDPSAAEDLAQETLLEAWRHRDSVREPDRHAQWLTGIARNVCFRWVRHRGRDLAHLAPLPGMDGLAAPDDAEAPSEAFGADATAGASVEIALEREELAALLDRALALLLPETRAALVADELDEIPLAEDRRAPGSARQRGGHAPAPRQAYAAPRADDRARRRTRCLGLRPDRRPRLGGHPPLVPGVRRAPSPGPLPPRRRRPLAALPRLRRRAG